MIKQNMKGEKNKTYKTLLIYKSLCIQANVICSLLII